MESVSSSLPESSLAPVSELLRRGWALYKSNAKTLALIALVPFLAYGIGAAVFAGSVAGAVFVGGVSGVGATISIVVVILLVMTLIASLVLIQLAATIASIKTLAGESAGSVKESFLATRPIISSFLKTSLLTGVLTMGAYGLFIIPGIAYNILFSFVVYIAILEGIFGFSALAKSYAYVADRFAPVLWRLVGTFAFAVPIMIISVGLESIFRNIGLAWLGSLATNLLSSLVATPLILAYMFGVYRDVRRAAGDVQPRLDIKKKVIGISIAGFIVAILTFGLIGFWASQDTALRAGFLESLQTSEISAE